MKILIEKQIALSNHLRIPLSLKFCNYSPIKTLPILIDCAPHAVDLYRVGQPWCNLESTSSMYRTRVNYHISKSSIKSKILKKKIISSWFKNASILCGWCWRLTSVGCTFLMFDVDRLHFARWSTFNIVDVHNCCTFHHAPKWYQDRNVTSCLGS